MLVVAGAAVVAVIRKIGCRFIPEIFPGRAYVGVGERNVAVSGHVDPILLGFDFQLLLQNVDQDRHRHRLSVAEVVNSVRSGTRFLAARPGALAGGVQGPQAALDDVVNVGEVAGQVGTVLSPVHRDGLPLEDVACEGEISHVGPAPRAVDGEEAEPGDGEAVDVVVGVGDLLAGFFGGGVEAGGAVCAIGLGEGDAVVEPVDGAGGGPNDGGLGSCRHAGL
ncbi:hypothetical protein V2J09_018875 [Rumex salicifolius]